MPAMDSCAETAAEQTQVARGAVTSARICATFAPSSISAQMAPGVGPVASVERRYTVISRTLRHNDIDGWLSASVRGDPMVLTILTSGIHR